MNKNSAKLKTYLVQPSYALHHVSVAQISQNRGTLHPQRPAHVFRGGHVGAELRDFRPQIADGRRVLTRQLAEGGPNGAAGLAMDRNFVVRVEVLMKGGGR